MGSEDYKPDFAPHDWSERDLHFLQPFATNSDGLISVLRNLPPEIVGALCSRASRAKGSLLEILLKEYIYPIIDGDDQALAHELETTVTFLKEHGFQRILNNHRAQKFYAKWLSQYGDDSIAQMTGTHVVMWGISQVAMKFMEDQRVGLEPIEKSTRYVNFGNKVGGRYLYYIPKPDLERHGLLSEYTSTMDQLFDTYVGLLDPLGSWLRSHYDESDSILEKKAFDTLRGLLPMATLGQVALRGNAQAFEYLLNRTAQHPLGELRWLSGTLKSELDQEIPSLLLRQADAKSKDYQEYLTARHTNVRQMVSESSGKVPERTIESAVEPEVNLVEYDPDGENKILTAILFEHSHVGWSEAQATIERMSDEEKHDLMARYMADRPARWYKVGRALENSYLRFEVLVDIGSYRDLHRHRMMTQERQLFSTHHGYDVPPELADAGLENDYSEALERAAQLFDKLEQIDPDLAQYAVPLAYRIRFYQWQNFRQFFWETELRTISQGHPTYRKVEQEKYRLVCEKFPLLSRYLLVDMNDYGIARRGTEEKIAEKEDRIVSRLTRLKDRPSD
jgi:thymidylate synthase ThyX